MKRRFAVLFICFILLVCLVAGCKKGKNNDGAKDISNLPTQGVTPEAFEGSLKGTMTKEDFPLVDGSTATIPISEAVYQFATGATAEEASNAIVHTKTSNCYYRLMNREVDLLIVYAPSEQVLEDIAKDGDNLIIKPIGKDALVFMANTTNPVESLTHQQIIDIYSGKIDNWSEVGGEDKEILAFQRPENTGSQTLMLKLVMGDVPMVTGPKVKSFQTMEGILEAMADYNNEGNTLGYSVFYYAKNMYQLPELRFMKVDGIEPSLDTIYDNSYPYINEFYTVIRKDEPEDSNAHKIFDWLSASEGQSLIKELGYVPVSMDVSEDASQEVLMQPDVIPEGYRYVATSYSYEFGINMGKVTIYDGKWNPVRVFNNANFQDTPGLISEDKKVIIGYGTKQEDGSLSIQAGLYDLKTNEFILPAEYSTLDVLNEEKGYYIINNKEKYCVIDLKGNKLTSDFAYGEGYNVTKQGDYYWINNLDYDMNKERLYIYDSDFNLVKEADWDYNKAELFDYDGTVYFSKEMFMKKFNFTEGPEDTFYCQNNYGEPIFSVFYNGTYYVLDRNLKILVQKVTGDDYNSYYNIYGDIFSDTYYDSNTFTESGLFYDKNANLILDEKGNSFTNIVEDNYWRGRTNNDHEQILYRVWDHTLMIFDYQKGTRMEIDLGDWQNISVLYVYKDIVVVQKQDGTQSTRIYKGNTLLNEKEGVYYLSYFANAYQTDNILLVNYGNSDLNYTYLLYNGEGELVYESPYPENILSIDDKYIQLERGNYWGVIDKKGKYIIKGIRNSLSND